MSFKYSSSVYVNMNCGCVVSKFKHKKKYNYLQNMTSNKYRFSNEIDNT